jgi:hypothetical protein
MSMTDRREPADARTAPQAATTSTTTNQIMANNPYPLTTDPPYGRRTNGPRHGRRRLVSDERWVAVPIVRAALVGRPKRSSDGDAGALLDHA